MTTKGNKLNQRVNKVKPKANSIVLSSPLKIDEGVLLSWNIQILVLVDWDFSLTIIKVN